MASKIICPVYILAAIVETSRCVELSLYYVSVLSDWSWYVFTASWFLLFAEALWSATKARWRALAILATVLVITGVPTINIGSEAIVRVQDAVFRTYALRQISVTTLKEFLSKCKIVDYIDDSGKQQQVGQCDKGIRSVPWLYLSVIYDPSGEFSLPGYCRSITWRLAVQGRAGSHAHSKAGLRFGSALAGTDRRIHLTGAFYYAKIYPDEWTGDNEEPFRLPIEVE